MNMVTKYRTLNTQYKFYVRKLKMPCLVARCYLSIPPSFMKFLSPDFLFVSLSDYVVAEFVNLPFMNCNT
jgi:hypothetical protein